MSERLLEDHYWGRVSQVSLRFDDAQARTSRRSPQSRYDPVSLPRRPCDARTWTPPNAKEPRKHDTSAGTARHDFTFSENAAEGPLSGRDSTPHHRCSYAEVRHP